MTCVPFVFPPLFTFRSEHPNRSLAGNPPMFHCFLFQAHDINFSHSLLYFCLQLIQITKYKLLYTTYKLIVSVELARPVYCKLHSTFTKWLTPSHFRFEQDIYQTIPIAGTRGILHPEAFKWVCWMLWISNIHIFTKGSTDNY